MTTLRVRGVDVKFPFVKAYGPQMGLINMALKCIGDGSNGVSAFGRFDLCDADRNTATRSANR